MKVQDWLDPIKYGLVFKDEVENNLGKYFDWNYFKNSTPKFHTIRSGNRWKVGDKFSPRVWSCKPYRSKQIVIAPDIEIKQTWSFEIENKDIFIDYNLYSGAENLIAKNDGLETNDFLNWFKYPKPFSGQIISWDEKIKY